MKSGEDFRQAMGQADDGFVRMIAQALSDLRIVRKGRPARRRDAVPLAGRQKRVAAAVTQDA